MQLERHGDVALLRMRGTKANSMTPEMVAALGATVGEVVASDACALVITGEGRFFSAGLALPELVALGRSDLRAFMETFARTMRVVFSAPKPIVAAINGHAIAGGTVLALQCDVRIAAAGDQRIGLNEAQLGIALPTSVMEPLRFAVAAKHFAEVALEGRLFPPAEALFVGLVDAVVPAEELEAAALARARTLAAIPPAAFSATKESMRRPVLEAILRYEADDAERWLDTWFSTEAQERLRATVAKLGG
jgi:enoyl-CoA hydratase/carnithine racemase